MKKNKNLLNLANEWFARCKNDLETAKILLREKGPSDTLCFHCQQAVEKALKGYLVFNGVDITGNRLKIHDLRKLLQVAEKYSLSLAKFTEKTNILNRYYIETRYPLDAPVEYSHKETDKTVKIAEEIVNQIIKISN